MGTIKKIYMYLCDACAKNLGYALVEGAGKGTCEFCNRKKKLFLVTK